MEKMLCFKFSAAQKNTKFKILNSNLIFPNYKQNILIINSIYMLTFKKSKTQKSPYQSILLYKSAQLKDPNNPKNKRQSRSHDTNEDLMVGNSLSVKQRDKEGDQVFKTNRKTEKSIGNSTCDYKASKTAKKKSIQDPFEQSQIKDAHYKMKDLLGFSNSISKKQSLTSSLNRQILSEIKNYQNMASENFQLKKLRGQNEQLMRLNEQLLYEKQYYKQKTILQEVQIRDLSRKLTESTNQMLQKKSHFKNKSCSKQSDLSFKLKNEEGRKQKKNDFYLFKEKKASNFGNSTEKSSLLISQSDQQKISNQNKLEDEHTSSISYIRKTQNEFAQLLESVQNQNNHNRKLTLRKMLALKAMQLKKMKQK